jgi:AraC-like DNA-binding protein
VVDHCSISAGNSSRVRTARRRLSRRFREAYGETPYGYLQTRHVERAMALLRR